MLEQKLNELEQSDIYPFHMPGHKRAFLPFANPYAIDITEIEGFDNLHHATGILQEAQHEIAALGKSGENDRPTVVVIGEVILKGVLDIGVGGAQSRCTLVFRQAVGIEAGLAVIGRKKTAVGVVDAFFHVGGAEKICLCIGVVEGHVFCFLCAGVDGRADEENVGCGVCTLCFVVGPVFRYGVVHAVCLLLGAAGKKHEAEQERYQENVVFVVSLFHAITFLK